MHMNSLEKQYKIMTLTITLKIVVYTSRYAKSTIPEKLLKQASYDITNKIVSRRFETSVGVRTGDMR